MKNRKFTSIGLTVLIAAFLWATPIWASEQDTGYPWFVDIQKDNPAVSKHNNIFRVAPVLPSKHDTGYPWFADTQEYKETKTKPITIFGVHPRTAEEDTGYPWSNDSKRNNQTVPQSRTMTQ